MRAIRLISRIQFCAGRTWQWRNAAQAQAKKHIRYRGIKLVCLQPQRCNCREGKGEKLYYVGRKERRGSKLAKTNEQIKAAQTSPPLVCVEVGGKSSNSSANCSLTLLAARPFFPQQRDSIMSRIGDRDTECCCCRILWRGRVAVHTGLRHCFSRARAPAVHQLSEEGVAPVHCDASGSYPVLRLISASWTPVWWYLVMY